MLRNSVQRKWTAAEAKGTFTQARMSERFPSTIRRSPGSQPGPVFKETLLKRFTRESLVVWKAQCQGL